MPERVVVARLVYRPIPPRSHPSASRLAMQMLLCVPIKYQRFKLTTANVNPNMILSLCLTPATPTTFPLSTNLCLHTSLPHPLPSFSGHSSSIRRETYLPLYNRADSKIGSHTTHTTHSKYFDFIVWFCVCLFAIISFHSLGSFQCNELNA